MVKVASLFSQLLHHVPRSQFATLVAKHQVERSAKGFTCWTQFVAMMFCQLVRADSLRDIYNGLAALVVVNEHLFDLQRRGGLLVASLGVDLFVAAAARENVASDLIARNACRRTWDEIVYQQP